MRWRLLKDLLGRNDPRFVALLCGQVDAACEAAEVLRDACEQGVVDGLAEQVTHLEQVGDDHRSTLITELSRALTTPLDPEDLFRVSRSIDDVLDYLGEFTDELTLLRPKDVAAFTGPLAALGAGLQALHDALEHVDGRVGEVTVTARDVKRQSGVHDAYQQALAVLFDGELSMETLKQRELLRRLDVAGLRLEEAADALSDAALKRA